MFVLVCFCECQGLSQPHDEVLSILYVTSEPFRYRFKFLLGVEQSQTLVLALYELWFLLCVVSFSRIKKCHNVFFVLWLLSFTCLMYVKVVGLRLLQSFNVLLDTILCLQICLSSEFIL